MTDPRRLAARSLATAVVGAAALAAAAPASAGGTTAVITGGGAFGVRPASIHLVSNENLVHAHWTTWGGATAHGTGTSAANGPSPGHHARNPVRVRLSGHGSCGGRPIYTTVTLTYTHGVPYKGMSHTESYKPSCTL